jgi:hypothetical protein
MSETSAMTVLALGIAVLIAVVVGVLVVVGMAKRQALVDAPPPSEPTDFVAPVSSGGYRWRKTDETAQEFKTRVATENDRISKPPT